MNDLINILCADVIIDLVLKNFYLIFRILLYCPRLNKTYISYTNLARPKNLKTVVFPRRFSVLT